MGVPRVDRATSTGTTAESRQADPSWWLDRARSLVAEWRRENSPDEDKALAGAREAYLECIAHEDNEVNDIKVQAQVGLARLDFVVGDPCSTRSGLVRLSEALREHPYSKHIEEVIYLMAIQAAFPSKRQSEATAKGALEYLDFLRESYAPACEGAPTAMMQPRWDSAEETDTSSQQNGGMSLAPERWHIKGLQVGGLPAWALQFQIGLLASRMGNSTRGMEAMENAFTSYETWLPRSCRDNDDGTPDVDTLRKEWYNGVPHWTAWIQHPRYCTSTQQARRAFTFEGDTSISRKKLPKLSVRCILSWQIVPPKHNRSDPVQTHCTSEALSMGLPRQIKRSCGAFFIQSCAPTRRTWLDLGDIAYHQGAGCFHVAAEAYKGALERAGGLLPPKKQVTQNQMMICKKCTGNKC